jgi:hypothetical protein
MREVADVDVAIMNAWWRVKPLLLADPEELARRLARRKKAGLVRPPRGYCLAVRASDRRMTRGSGRRYLAEQVKEGMEWEVSRVPVYRKYRNEGERFRWWRWVCLACGKLVRTIYLPRKVPTVAEFFGDEKRLVKSEADELPAVRHRLMNFLTRLSWTLYSWTRRESCLAAGEGGGRRRGR